MAQVWVASFSRPSGLCLIAGAGFVPASLAIGGIMLTVVGILSVLVFRHTSESTGQHPDGVKGALSWQLAVQSGSNLRRSFLRDRRTVTLAVGKLSGLFAQIGLLAHLFSLLVPVPGKPDGQRHGRRHAACIPRAIPASWKH